MEGPSAPGSNRTLIRVFQGLGRGWDSEKSLWFIREVTEVKRIHDRWVGKGWVRTVAGTLLGIAISLSAPWVVQAVTSQTAYTISATPAAAQAAGVAQLFPVSEIASAASATESGTRVVPGESPQDWFKVFGSATLVKGAATVHLEPVFGSLASNGFEYQVYLTPKGDCNGLYLAHKTVAAFEVRELGQGTSNISFEYRIVARRRPIGNERLAHKTRPLDRRRLTKTTQQAVKGARQLHSSQTGSNLQASSSPNLNPAGKAASESHPIATGAGQ
jgi:hypothetical protein